MTSAEPDPTETVPDEPIDPRPASSTGVDGEFGAGEAKKTPPRKTPARAAGATTKATASKAAATDTAADGQSEGESTGSTSSPSAPAVKKPAARRTTAKKAPASAASDDASTSGDDASPPAGATPEAESTADAPKPARKPAARTSTARTTTARTAGTRSTAAKSSATKTSGAKTAASKASPAGEGTPAADSAPTVDSTTSVDEATGTPSTTPKRTASKTTTPRTTKPRATASTTATAKTPTTKTTAAKTPAAKTTAAKTTAAKTAAARRAAAQSADTPTDGAEGSTQTDAPATVRATTSRSTSTRAQSSAAPETPDESAASSAESTPSVSAPRAGAADQEATSEPAVRQDADGTAADERPQKPVLAASDAAPTAILSSPAPTLPSAPPAPPKPQLSASEAAELFAAAPEPATPHYRRSSPPPAPADVAADDVTRPVWQQPTSLLPTVSPADEPAPSITTPGDDASGSRANDPTEILDLSNTSSAGARPSPAAEPARRVVFSKKWPFIALVDPQAENAVSDGVSAHAAASTDGEPHVPGGAPGVGDDARDTNREGAADTAMSAQPVTDDAFAAPGAHSQADAPETTESEIDLTDEEIAAFGADPSWVDTESPLVEDDSRAETIDPRDDQPDGVAALFGAAESDPRAGEAITPAEADDAEASPSTDTLSTAAATDDEQEAAIDAIAVDAPEAHATPLGLMDSAAAPASLDEERRAAGAPSYAAGSGVLSVSGLSKRFGDTVAVDGIDLEVSAGSFYGIVGPNGAGKTTTLSMITGLLRPDSGSITINGIDVWKEPDAAKRSIGVLPDHLRLFDRLTGAQLLYYSGVLRGIDGATVRSRVDDLAKAFGLEDALHRLVTDYSAGMTKKVALAAAMIHSPRMLVLDEPFESVDPVSAANVIEILQKYVDHGGTVVLSSHGMDLIQRVCDHVAIIVNGQVLAQGSVDEVRGTGTLEERFVELAGGRKAAEGMEWLHSFSD
ncbi:ATP-binding cassette domain-containing protein [Okibacterium fritillariae]|uniref:ATP-binding cassette domain-containing protein n=1 Tax=Okibacterium fritillariae TaxID=123320 RepID=UPI0040558EC9